MVSFPDKYMSGKLGNLANLAGKWKNIFRLVQNRTVYCNTAVKEQDLLSHCFLKKPCIIQGKRVFYTVVLTLDHFIPKLHGYSSQIFQKILPLNLSGKKRRVKVKQTKQEPDYNFDSC